MRISDWSSDVCSSDLKDIVNLAKRTLGFDLSPKSGPAAASIAFESRNARMLVLDHAGNCSEGPVGDVPGDCAAKLTRCQTRSDERRVGKECVSTCRSRWSPYHYNKKIMYNSGSAKVVKMRTIYHGANDN